MIEQFKPFAKTMRIDKKRCKNYFRENGKKETLKEKAVVRNVHCTMDSSHPSRCERVYSSLRLSPRE